MTTNDLWHEVEVDPEMAALELAQREARRALAPKVSFLMEASCREAFEDRLALIDDDISTIVREAAGDGAAYALTRTAVVADLNDMFDRGDARRLRIAGAERARERRASVKKAATQAEVDAWLARMDPLFAEWAKPYAQRMVYGPSYNRSIATNLPEAARAFKTEGGMAGKQFRYVRSQLDAALGSERGEDWYWDEAQGEYTQRLQGTVAAKQAAYYVVLREGTGDPVEGPFDSEDEAKDALNNYPDEYMVATSEQLGKESRKQAIKIDWSLSAWGCDGVTADGRWGINIFRNDRDDPDSKYTMRVWDRNLPDDAEPAGVWSDFSTEEGARVDAEDFLTNWSVTSSRKQADNLTYSASAPANFIADFDKVSKALEDGGWVMTIEGGTQVLSPSAPPQLVSAFHGLLEMGYANGHFATRKQAVEIFDKPAGGARADVLWDLAVDNGPSKSWVTTGDGYNGQVSTTPEGAIAQYNGRFAGEFSNAGRAKQAVEEQIAKDFPNVFIRESKLAASDDYESTPEGIDSMWNAMYWRGQADAARAAEEGRKRLWAWKGQEVTVVKGRKIPVGTTGIVFYSGEGQWGWRIGFKTADGQELWTNLQNVELTSELSSTAAKLTGWTLVDGVFTTQVGRIAMTAVADRIGVAWAITSPDGETEYATGKSRTIESAQETMIKRADIFGQDPDVVNQTNPPKKKVPKKKIVGDNEPDEEEEDPAVEENAEDEVADEEDPDVVEDDVEDVIPPEGVVEDQVETVDPMTLDVGDTLTVSYTMGTGETGEVEGVFVRLEEDIAFFSGPNGEFGVAERDGVWIDSEGNQFSFSFGSPDVTGDTDPNADAGVPTAPADNPATPAENPPVADAKDTGDTEYAADDKAAPPKAKGKSDEDDGDDKKKPPWLKGKGSTMTGTLTVNPTTLTGASVNTGTPMSTTSVAYMITPTAPIRSMAELVTAIGALSPNLSPEQVFELAKQAMAASRTR